MAAVSASSCPWVASAVLRQPCSSILVLEVVVGDVVVERKRQRRCIQPLRKLEADKLQHSRSMNRHSWMCCKSSFARKLLFEYGRWNTDMQQSKTAMSKLESGEFLQSLALRLPMSDKRLSRTLGKLLLLPRWCSARSKRFVRLEHSRKVVVNSTTPWFRKLPYRSTEQNCDVFDKRCASLDTKHLPVEVAVERLVVLLCSHKRLPERKNLVVHKQSSQQNMALVLLALVLEFVAERSVRQRAQKLELHSQ